MTLRCWLFLLPVAVWAASLGDRIDLILSKSATARRAQWGIQIVDARTGEALYARASDHYFVPASNTKLFSTALALSRLGPDHRFRTRVLARNAPDAAGRVRGDLILLGGSDPTLSARAVPYKKGPIQGDPLAAIEELARSCFERGLRVVEGDITGDDSTYAWEPAPDGWTQDDATWEYGAPVSALTLNDNAFSLILRPGAHAGDPARVRLNPEIEYYYIDNRVRTEAGVEPRVEIERRPGSKELRLTGAVTPGWKGETEILAVDDPALFAAAAFRQALARLGVRITGQSAARHRFAGDAVERKYDGYIELASRTSPPLAEVLRIINKVSQNLHAELVLREVGRARRGDGAGREAGLKELEAFLTEAGVDKNEYRFEDGSGLSRLTLVTPETVVKLLLHMYRGPQRNAWVSLMPVGGEDGTLAKRFSGNPAGSRVHAKTGSLSHVSGLSGYLDTPSGVRIFSILVNNYRGTADEIRAAIDKICIEALQ
ncbi:MAG: D-alanyl-D-alanine carboxypeptidase/D-alanyl-D-alanine-endopeptidase [Bryobacteraceae bacterium]